MKKYANQFNELLVMAEVKKVKKGGGLGAILKLIQDLTDFENNIQDCIDAQDLQEYRGKINAFLTDIDKMYDVLFEMAKGGIQSMRSERGQVEGVDTNVAEPQNEEVVKDEIVEESTPKSVGITSEIFSNDDLKTQLNKVKPVKPIPPV